MAERRKGQSNRQVTGAVHAGQQTQGSSATDPMDRMHRLERIIRQLRERELLLRARLDRARCQLQSVGDQMAALLTSASSRPNWRRARSIMERVASSSRKSAPNAAAA